MDLSLILQQATFEALQKPEKRTVNRTVKPWVKIVPTEGKPKFKCSATTLELINNETGYIFLFESNGELYLATPSYWGETRNGEYEPNRKMESKILSSSVEMTKPVLDRVNVTKYAGEWLLVSLGETEVAHQKLGENVSIKVFKLTPNASVDSEGIDSSNQNFNLDATSTGETTEDLFAQDGSGDDETNQPGTEPELFDTDTYAGESSRSAKVLLEDEVF